jgi:hypothetical protein
MTGKAVFGVSWNSQCLLEYMLSLKNSQCLLKYITSLGIHYDIPYNSLFVC